MAPPISLHPRDTDNLPAQDSSATTTSPTDPNCWTRLPIPPPPGTRLRLHSCAGCHQGYLPNDTRLRCTFATTGFGKFCACGTTYHPECFQVGPPFTTRRKNGEGLRFPKGAVWPNFICEACKVRQVTQRELQPPDLQLMMFERMRMLDTISHWARGTHNTYASKLRVVSTFKEMYGVSILKQTELQEPPSGPEIPLMWCQELYSLKRTCRRREAGLPTPVAFISIRQLRSAVSQFFALDAQAAHPSESYYNKQNQLVYQACRPTDNMAYTLHAKGMRTRIGEDTKPSVALLDRHIRKLDDELNEQYLAANTEAERRELALAGLANLTFWLGWLRSREAFDLDWEDSELVQPADAGRLELPDGCGLLQFRLSPETKSDRHRRADCLMAFRTMSGLCIGKWFLRAKRHRTRRTGALFCHLDGTRWDSKFFRETYLYPSLHRQRAAGDEFLKSFDGSPGNSIEARFWSLHCYRRGGRSHVSREGRHGAHRFKKATQDQVYEHARWRFRRSSEAIDVIYREWTPYDRVQITLYCH